MINIFFNIMNKIKKFVCEPYKPTSEEELKKCLIKCYLAIILGMFSILNTMPILLPILLPFDYVKIEAELIEIEKYKVSGRTNVTYFVYKYDYDGKEYISLTPAGTNIFAKVGDKHKIDVYKKDPYYIKEYDQTVYLIALSSPTLIFSLIGFKIKPTKEYYKNYLEEQEKNAELKLCSYKLNNSEIILPNRIKSVVKLKYGVAILTELPEDSECPRNIYNYLDDGRLLWQINPNYDIFGIKELQKYIDFKYQFSSLSLNNNLLYTSTCGVNFAIDIGTGRCVSYDLIK